MVTPGELTKKLNEQFSDLVTKEKELVKEILNSATIEEALVNLSKAEEVYGEIQKLDKKIIYLRRAEALAQTPVYKGIGLT
jgi:hypothetical protein